MVWALLFLPMGLMLRTIRNNPKIDGCDFDDVPRYKFISVRLNKHTYVMFSYFMTFFHFNKFMLAPQGTAWYTRKRNDDNNHGIVYNNQ